MVLTEHREFKIGKSQLAHLFTCVVVLLVAISNRLPAMRDIVAGYKDDRFRNVVPSHVTVDVSLIPGVTLSFEYGTNGFDRFCVGLFLSGRKCRHGEDEKSCSYQT